MQVPDREAAKVALFAAVPFVGARIFVLARTNLCVPFQQLTKGLWWLIKTARRDEGKTVSLEYHDRPPFVREFNFFEPRKVFGGVAAQTCFC